MSKSLSIIAVALFACDPITTSVVELPLRDAATRDAEPTVREPDEKDGTTRVEVDEEGCLSLLDQSIPLLVVNEPEDAVVLARTSEAAGCGDADAGAPLLHASVFSRRDGAPIVERGRRYSYRWPDSVAMTRVNLRGGKEACADEPVVFAEGALNWAPKGVASCYEFTAPISATYVHTTAADYLSPLAIIGLSAPPKLRLCEAPCPEGTEPPVPVDAGASDAALYDATTPPLPTWP